MPIENWLAFVAASAIMLAIPGPTILLVISYALGHGRKASSATVAGVALGDFTAMTASMLGLGALLATSAALFTVLKWVGAAYLIYLGIKLWRAPVGTSAQGEGDVTGRERPLKIFLHTYIVTALNPKSIIFFVAFLPQFLVPTLPFWPQVLIFEVTFLVLATCNAALYGLLASAARNTIRKPSVQRVVNRTGGGLLIGAGLLAAGWKKPSLKNVANPCGAEFWNISMSVPHILLALVTVFLWGFNFVVIKVGVMDMPPLFLTALRYLFAAVPLIFFLPRPKVPWKHMVVYGMVMGCAQFGLLYTAIKWGLPAGLASLVMQSQAFFTMALAVTMLGEIPLKSHIAGAAVAFSGLAVIGLERLELTALVPLLMCVGAAFSWAIGNIVNRKVGRVNAISFVAWTSLAPVLPLIALSLLLEGPQAIGEGLANSNLMTVAVVAYMAYGATIVGAGIWSFLLLRYPAGTVAPFSLLVPIVGFLGAYFAFAEHITTLEIVGSALVVAGLALNVFGRRLSFGRAPSGNA